jgi:hypothetical protein
MADEAELVRHPHWELRTAAKSGDVRGIEDAVAAGADPDAADGPLRDTALHHAASRGHTAAITALLTVGVRVDSTDSAGMTPLMAAAVHGAAAPVLALLAAGADVQHVSALGDTSLHVAAKMGMRSAVCELLAAGGRADVLDRRGKRPSEVVRGEEVEGGEGGGAHTAACCHCCVFLLQRWRPHPAERERCPERYPPPTSDPNAIACLNSTQRPPP